MKASSSWALRLSSSSMVFSSTVVRPSLAPSTRCQRSSTSALSLSSLSISITTVFSRVSSSFSRDFSCSSIWRNSISRFSGASPSAVAAAGSAACISLVISATRSWISSSSFSLRVASSCRQDSSSSLSCSRPLSFSS